MSGHLLERPSRPMAAQSRLQRFIVPVALALLACPQVHAQTTDEIVAKNLQARGGVDKLKAITSVKTTGTVSARGMELPMTTWAKRPNMMRRENRFQDQTIIFAFDGTTAWGIDPRMGSATAQEIGGPAADIAKEDAGFDPLLLDYKQKGHSVELVGAEPIDGRGMHHLKVTKKNGQVQHFYLSADTGLEARLVMPVEQGGMKADVTFDYSDYRSVDGLMVPFAVKQSMNGREIAQVALESVQFNVPIEDAFFRMPTK